MATDFFRIMHVFKSRENREQGRIGKQKERKEEGRMDGWIDGPLGTDE